VSYSFPARDAQYDRVPWGWVFTLSAFELLAGLVVGTAIYAFKLDGHAYTVVVTIAVSMGYALECENRKPGVLTPALRRALALKASAVTTLFGFTVFGIMAAMTPEALPFLTSGLIAIAVAIGFLVSWGLHVTGLRMGTRIASKRRTPNS
jgi:hypothetical protein